MPLPRIQRLIIEKLQELEKLTEIDKKELLNTPKEISGQALEKKLINEFRLSEMDILYAKSRAFNMGPFLGKRFKINERTFERLDEKFCIENRVIPIGYVCDTFIVATANPFDLQSARKIEKITQSKISSLLALEVDIEDILKITQQKQDAQSLGDYGEVVSAISEKLDINTADLTEKDLENEESAPIIQLANRIVEEAFFSGASDIHIEPQEKNYKIRIRIDGICNDKLTLPSKLGIVLVTRYKVMGNLDIAEKRLPQDGRITFQNFSNKSIEIDLRISTAPLNHGEGIVMRILDKQKATLSLNELGYEPENLKKYKEVIKRPYGMILHCGPTGSGKSMTLYSALNVINNSELVIRTAEDPIEYTQAGICQMQVNSKIGLTFANALRSFLRQDPDVILVGEIRDRETASIAIEAALTGHLLFSTLHTNDAAGTIQRLTEMEIEPFMISASLICICAQRLLRRVCPNCAQSYRPEGREKEILERAIAWEGEIFKAHNTGCPNCNRSGYKGRIGIHELMSISETLTHKINQRASAGEIKVTAIEEGMKTLHQDSMLKVKKGVSTMAEAIACIPTDLEKIKC